MGILSSLLSMKLSLGRDSITLLASADIPPPPPVSPGDFSVNEKESH